ncbi:MAG: prephenate dehydrogenase [Eubacteriales bacterium]|nr:prephenate dehydrogenase [Eubacteriales bacterium]MDD4583806.1 prephenate dehydrogenase [Eubacteriales bacterium]
MDLQRFQITIIGLGLIGGSMAMALRGFKNARIIGVDVDPYTLEKALELGVIDEAYENVDDGVTSSDLVILCVYPHHIIEIVSKNLNFFKKGSVVSDVCGAKSHLYKMLGPLIPYDVDYIGIHPMAGKEVDGFENADGRIFYNAGFIITPLPFTRTESLVLMKELGAHIGSRVTVIDPESHDEIIAYTSDLMHLAATALCMDFHPAMTSVYTAGAFRDCTRIANINPALWTELFLLNGDSILPYLNSYINYLNRLEQAIGSRDKDQLYRLLEKASINKKEMLKR